MKATRIMTALMAATFAVTLSAQTGLKKVYNEDIDPMEQIDGALVKAKAEGKTNYELAKELNVNRCTITVYIKEYNQKYANTVISH